MVDGPVRGRDTPAVDDKEEEDWGGNGGGGAAPIMEGLINP